MARNKVFVVQFRRKRQKKTNYKTRLRLLLSNKPRFVVRASLKNVIVQIVDYKPEGDKILISANSKELKKIGWNSSNGNVPASYLVGLLLAKKALKKGISEGILDIGFQGSVRGARVFAALNGLVDGGMKIPHNKEVLPGKDRISGKHIADYANKLKNENKELYSKQFSSCLKNNMQPENLVAHFEQIKNKIETM